MSTEMYPMILPTLFFIYEKYSVLYTSYVILTHPYSHKVIKISSKGYCDCFEELNTVSDCERERWRRRCMTQ